MFLERIFLASVIVGSAIVAAACSDESPKPAPTKHRAEAACEHINDVCADTEGFQTQDCLASKASYEKLNASDKAKANAVVPCIMAAKSCQPAINCLKPAADDSTETANEKTSEHDTEDACEHINDVCKNEEGFQKQDCSSSNADYEDLTAADKKKADAIIPCIMDAEACENAFQCLKLD